MLMVKLLLLPVNSEGALVKLDVVGVTLCDCETTDREVNVLAVGVISACCAAVSVPAVRVGNAAPIKGSAVGAVLLAFMVLAEVTAASEVMTFGCVLATVATTGVFVVVCCAVEEFTATASVVDSTAGVLAVVTGA